MAQSAVSTLAGSGSVGSANGTGTAASFQFTNPSGAAVDSSGNIFIADAGNHTIRKVTPAGVVTTFAGTAGMSGSTNATGSDARFNQPRGISVDGAGNVFVADTANHIIRMITSAGVVSTLAGTAGIPGSDNGTGAAARFSSPMGIAAEKTGSAVNVYVADTQNQTVRQIVVATGVVTTLAGTAGSSGNAIGTGAAARFNLPVGLVLNSGNTTLYVADRFNHIIRQIVISTGAVTTLAGSGAPGSSDGSGIAASFNNPTGVTLDGSGNVVVTDTFNHTIRSITTAGFVTTIAGSAGSSGSTNGLSTAARFNFPSGIAFASGNTNIVDTNNQLVRKLSPAVAPSLTGQPIAQSAAVGGSVTFSVTASGNPPVSYQWQIQPGGTGSFSNLTASTTYVGVNTKDLTVNNLTSAMNGDRFQVVVSNGVGASATSSAATLTVTAPPVFTSATSANFVVGQNTNFSVTVTGSPTPTISTNTLPGWLSFNTITNTLTGAPSSTDGNAVVVFTATNSAGSVNQSFNATVVTTTPPTPSTVANQMLGSGVTSATFTVSATGTPSEFTYQWQRSTDGGSNWSPLTDTTIDGATYSGTTGTTLGISGITPAMNENRFRAVVTSTGGSTPSNGAILGVPPLITSPATASFVFNQGSNFTFTAAGNPAPVITITHNGLPENISFSSPNLSGTPTQTFGSTTFITVSATNSGGTATQNFTLNIGPAQAPIITSATSAVFNVGQSSSFTFTATGTPTPTIQVFGSRPPGVEFNSSTNTLSGTPTTTVGSPFIMSVQANNSSGTVTQTFSLTVLGVAPIISTHPSSATANVGQPATFTAAATGTPEPTIRWQRLPNGTGGWINLVDDGIYSGTTGPTLTIISVSPAMSLDQFRIVATNGTAPDATSNAAVLNVNLGTVISTIAGQAGFLGSSNGTGSVARFSSPTAVAADFSGNIYIADAASHTIRKMTPAGAVTTLAGQAGFSGSVDGLGSAARFNSPQGIAVDAAGNVFVADTFNHTIRVIDPSGNVTTIAGMAASSGAVDANGTAARFFGPTALALDFAGTLYIADSSNHTIRRMAITRDVTTIAGTPGSASFADGFGTSARFASPGGLALDTSGNLYVADSLNQVIRRITNGSVSTIAGLAGNAGITDGNGSAARFNRPTGIALDSSGNLYVADTLSSTIRKFVISTSEVTTVAGLAMNTGSDDGAGNTARFNQPTGIVVDLNGNIYIADRFNHTIRRSGSPIAPRILTNPVSKTASPGDSVTFTVSAAGAPLPGYQWQRVAAGSGDFVNLINDGVYSGVNTTTLTIANVTSVMNGDQFRVVANNGVPSPAVSELATLTIGVAPVFSSAASATFQAERGSSFTVQVTSDPAATFSLTGNPSWLSIDSASGVLSGTPPDTAGSPHTFTISANNGLTATQTFVLTVTPAVLPPAITAQPASLVLNQGQTATFSVTLTGTEPFSYQWRRNTTAIAGATNSTLLLPNVQPAATGSYSVTVTNAAGSITSNAASLAVNTFPTVVLQPYSQTALVGSGVTFIAGGEGGGGLAYQWRRNGVPIASATSGTLQLNNVSASDTGFYDVLITNSIGAVTSAVAQLTVATSPVAPVITAQPQSRTALVGTSTSLSVGVSAAPAPSYQWRRNGSNIGGANGPVYTIASVQAGDAANYDVVITNSLGNATSNLATLRVISRSYAGFYFGNFGGGLGNFAMYIRPDNTGVFLGYLPGSTAPVMSHDVLVDDNGSFTFTQGSVGASSTSLAEEPARAAALSSVVVSGTIGTGGNVSGSIAGGANASITASRIEGGATPDVAGAYRVGSITNAATIWSIVAPNGQVLAVAQNGNTFDGGQGTATNSGSLTVNTGRSTITQNITAVGGTVTGTAVGVIGGSFSGGSDVALSRQRLVNISSRARVGSGDSVAIAGFVISGEVSKPVLIRAVGPTLGTAPFNVLGALASPRLELFRQGNNTALLTNAGIAANRSAIDAAGQQAGAFALGSAGADAAILTTLAPGNYTAVVSSTTNTAGVALIEVYDLSGTAVGQKLLNISTRAAAGTGENTLIAGFVIPPGPAKRVLVRGIGPGLSAFNVTGVLPQPTLTLLRGTTTVAQNSNWSTSADAAAISTASTQVGAFTMAPQDAAMVVTLEPGNYTAQIVGAGGASGVALIEVYELP